MHFKGIVMANCSYTRDTAEGVIHSGAADMVSFVRGFMSNRTWWSGSRTTGRSTKSSPTSFTGTHRRQGRLHHSSAVQIGAPLPAEEADAKFLKARKRLLQNPATAQSAASDIETVSSRPANSLLPNGAELDTADDVSGFKLGAISRLSMGKSELYSLWRRIRIIFSFAQAICSHICDTRRGKNHSVCGSIQNFAIWPQYPLLNYFHQLQARRLVPHTRYS
ncbi:Aldolase-type TIM barrel [Phytophthora cactorum]|nr:Aldolase-type TIM barrel [Phytophthora cactorum]